MATVLPASTSPRFPSTDLSFAMTIPVRKPSRWTCSSWALVPPDWPAPSS